MINYERSLRRAFFNDIRHYDNVIFTAKMDCKWIIVSKCVYMIITHADQARRLGIITDNTYNILKNYYENII